MQSALCSVYVPGGSPEIEGMTGINAARTVMNAAFGMELPLIPPAEGYVLPEIYNARESVGGPLPEMGSQHDGPDQPPRDEYPNGSEFYDGPSTGGPRPDF